MPKNTSSHCQTERATKRAIGDWFSTLGWRVLPHQQETWDHVAQGQSGLVVMPTGAGKTYSVFLGFLPLLAASSDALSLIYITPLKALTRDIEASLIAAVGQLAPHLKPESRTGDTKASARQKQKKKPPHILVTTPESLALLLSYDDAAERFAHLQGVIVDEWHDLLGTKRGSLLELNMAQLRRLQPKVQIWGLSATLANPEEAARCLVGPYRQAQIVTSPLRREVRLETFWPDDASQLPWAGHLGLRLAPQLAQALSLDRSTLIFTNTRSQAERWHDALTLLMPEWEDALALHHGSLDPKERQRVERGVKEGRIKIVVCTASLDLGVDFPAVDLVVQIGSPKQLARLIQRAGRSAHRPGAASDVWFVPTHALELVEAAAFREALARQHLEPRRPLEKPFDVLIQYLVSRALAGGFRREDLTQELRDTVSFASISQAELDWVLRFATDGGGTLASYPQYRKVVMEQDLYQVKDRMIALRHRQNIGTITSDGSVTVKLGRSKTLGTVEESFLAKIRPGETFLFAGRWLALVTLREMTAYVRASTRKSSGVIPTWTGGSLPWSAELSQSMRGVLDHYQRTGRLHGEVEWRGLDPILKTQARLSIIPGRSDLLVEVSRSREGQHVFVFPFAGKSMHEGLAAIWSLRLSRRSPSTYSFAVNDYGLEILTDDSSDLSKLDWDQLLAPEDTERDLEEALHLGELAKRHFRGIARVSGLILQNLPGHTKTSRQLQTSSSILYDVFAQFDPQNLLLKQAKGEALRALGDGQGLATVLGELALRTVRTIETPIFSPFAFPLYLERMAGQISSETLSQRIMKMQERWIAGTHTHLPKAPIKPAKKPKKI